MTKPTKWSVRQAKTQISLGIRPVWSESSLSAWRNLGSFATQWMHNEDSDQTGQMPRLIWVFAGRTVHFVGFVMLRLKLQDKKALLETFSTSCNIKTWKLIELCENSLKIDVKNMTLKKIAVIIKKKSSNVVLLLCEASKRWTIGAHYGTDKEGSWWYM